MLSCPAFSQAAHAVEETADAPAGSVPLQSSKEGVAPMAALGIGLAATVVPIMFAYSFTADESRAEDVGLFVGATVGVVAGPAFGLWSGGRDDLAKRGLIARSIGAGLCLGAMGVASATWEDGTQDSGLTAALVILGTVGGLMTAGSLLHDLSITHSATSHGKPVSVGLGVRGDGLLAVRMRF
jgi:putative effector of murein hydrolase